MSREVFNHQWSAGRGQKGSAMRGSNDGPNWLLLAGGAAVTALSFVIGRRQKQYYEGGVEVQEGNLGKPQVSSHKDNIEPNLKQLESKAVESNLRQESFGRRGLQLLEDTSLSDLDDNSLAPNEDGTTRQSHINLSSYLNGPSQHTFQGDSDFQGGMLNIGSGWCTSSPASTEVSEEEMNTSRTCSPAQESQQSIAQQGMQTNRIAKRDMVHRLRKQLKSRDEMILNMQAQISEHDRDMTLSHAHISELQSHLEATDKVLHESEIEVQHLRKEVAGHFAHDIKRKDLRDCGSEGENTIVNVGDGSHNEGAILVQLKELRDDLVLLEKEKRAVETEWKTLSRKHNSVLQKVEVLESELENQKKLVVEKDNLLELSKEEFLGLNARFQDLQSKLEAQVGELEALKANKVKLEVQVRDSGLKRCVNGNPVLSGGKKSILRTSKEIPNSLIHQLGCDDIDMTFSSSDCSDNAESNVNGESKRKDSSEVSEVFDEMEKVNTKEEVSVGLAVSESTVAALQQEVEQLTTALATQSKVVLEQKQEANDLIEDFQQTACREDTIQSTLDATKETSKPAISDWIDPSKPSSFSIKATAPAMVHEISNKLIELAKQKKVEEEMAELTRHKNKISELQERIAKLTCDSVDEVRNEQTLRAAALIYGLAEKLAIQEEQARQTALEVQRLSASFQILTPIVANFKNQEMNMEREGTNPGHLVPHSNGHVKHSIPICEHWYSGQDREADKIAIHLSEPEIKFSPDNTRPAYQNYLQHPSPSELVEQSYEFQVGALGSPVSKMRRLSFKGQRRTSQRRKHLFQDYSSGRSSSQDEDSSTHSATASSLHQGVAIDFVLDNNSFSEDMESDTKSASEQQPNLSSWEIEERNTDSAFKVEQLMASNTSGQETNFLPTSEEFSPPVQIRSSPEVTGSSRRYLFASDFDHANHRDTAAGYLVAGKEIVPEETSSESSFTVPPPESSSLSPFSQMMAQLDSNESLSLSSLQKATTTGISDSTTTEDNIHGEISLPEDGEESQSQSQSQMSTEGDHIDESKSELGSESGGSFDEDFNDILDGTLDDFLKVCSAPATPADTPTSSILSQGGDSRNA